MLNRVGKICVAAMSLCIIVLIVTNKLLLSESAVSCLLRVRSVSFTAHAKGCIKIVHHSCLVSLSHIVGVFLEEAICYFIYVKFAVMLGCFSRFASFRLDYKIIRCFHMFIVVASL